MKTFIASIVLFISTQLSAQAVTTIPEFPTQTDSITLTFNIQEMTNKSLIGYTGTLYAHTGINTNLGDWRWVIGSWGDNATQPSLTQVSTDIYKLTINNPRNFYNIPQNENIISLNFVLRSADGSLQSEDLFIPIYEKGINVKILNLESISFYPLTGETINITAIISGADSSEIYFNNELISQSMTDTVAVSIVVEGSGRQWLKFVARNDGDIYQDSTWFIVRDHITIEELPQSIKPGINYINDNTVTLALFAPNKKFVYALGDFNNWEFDPDTSSTWDFDENYYFKLTPDSTVYWITLNNLIPNQEYRFQYIVDGYVRIADPYADKILEQEDSYISDATYPNLIPYPTNKTFFSVSVFQTSQEEVIW